VAVPGHTYPDRTSPWFFLFREEKELNRGTLFGSFSFAKETEHHREPISEVVRKKRQKSSQLAVVERVVSVP
jgi:hypothetical protein